jgi:hypothetical protein
MPVFTPTLGTASPEGGLLYDRQLYGIDPRTNAIIYSEVSGSPSTTNLGTYVGLPPFSKTEHFTVRSQAEADIKVGGAGLLNQMYITAEATAQGNPLVAQGSMIYVQNANGSQNGLWFVTEAKHCVTKHRYQMDLCLGRDSMGATVSLGVVQGTSLQPAARLVDQSWVAAA